MMRKNKKSEKSRRMKSKDNADKAQVNVKPVNRLHEGRKTALEKGDC